MNRKNLVLTLAALLNILFLASTCGVAWASPVFYAKIDNRTNYPVKVKWYFSTRDDSRVAPDRVITIAPHTTQRFSGPAGYGKFHYKFHTGGQGSPIKGYYLNAVTDPRALGCLIYINYTGQGFTAVKQNVNDNF
jgi:hypothetical protein